MQSAAGEILQARGRNYHWSGAQPLSIKTFTGGRALYEVGQGRFVVDDGGYLVVNEAQPYTISIESSALVESCCVFFAPGFAAAVHRSLATPAAALLDARGPDTASLQFFERTYPHDALVSPIMRQLRAAQHSRMPDVGWPEERLYALMARLLQAHQNVQAEVARLPAVRAATRDEIYRRLHLARDYAVAMYATPLTLHELAGVACLSPNHFLRTFRQVFAQTPHQFVTAKRMETACQLLRHTEQPITQICLAVGFTSLGSFSTLFRRTVGISPEGYRRQQKGDFQEAPRPLMRDTPYRQELTDSR